ncbi:MAG TPA: cytochrome c family protein [Planctomycetota bacterium]|nr:cytochrome c family protein [Planctomycetota bacterium]
MRFASAFPVVLGALVVFEISFAARPGNGDDAKKATYIGATSCKKCHLKQFKTWKETKMAKAFDLLKAGQAKEAKEKFKLDPAKDYTKEEKCVRCHTTGYGEEGGYPKIGAADEKHLAADREGIQCEMCHGPASLYNAYMIEHEKDYDAAKGKSLGLVMPDAEGQSCLKCHKGGEDGSPTLAADVKFDGAKKMKEDGAIHAHVKK